MEQIAEIFILLMLAIVFLQSGIDKVTDWKGNLGWLQSHFSKTFIKGMVPFALALVLLLELVSGITAIVGAVMLWCEKSSSWALFSAVLSGITLLVLFLGQRLAKDYPGAQGIVVYLIPTMFLLYILSN